MAGLLHMLATKHSPTSARMVEIWEERADEAGALAASDRRRPPNRTPREASGGWGDQRPSDRAPCRTSGGWGGFPKPDDDMRTGRWESWFVGRTLADRGEGFRRPRPPVTSVSSRSTRSQVIPVRLPVSQECAACTTWLGNRIRSARGRRTHLMTANDPYRELARTGQLVAATSVPHAFFASHRLMAGILEDVARILDRARVTHRRDASVREARFWVDSNDHSWPFSFLRVCEALDLPSDETRRRLRCGLPARPGLLRAVVGGGSTGTDCSPHAAA